MDAVGFDVYNQAVTGDVAKSLTAKRSDADHTPVVYYPYVTDRHILDDQGGQQILVREDGKCPTLRAEAHGNVPCVLESAGFKELNSAKARSDAYEHEIAPCLSANKHDVCACVGVLVSSAVNAEHTDGEISPCLMARAGTGGNQLPLVALAYDARGNGDGITVPTITGDHNNRVTDYTCVCCEPVPIHDQATRFSGKRGDNYDGKGNGLGVGNPGDPMNTITSGDRHAVAYGTFQETGFGWWNDDEVATTLRTPCGGDATKANVVVTAHGIGNGQANQPFMVEKVGALNCMHDQQAICYGVDSRNATEYPEMTGALQADAAHNLNSNNVVRVQYIVRRLTPTECARLQGFPDDWAHPDQKSEFTDEEYEFWLNVRNTHAEINGKATKNYTKDQMLTWYNKLHTDSAEYKLWGNGIALPCALYVMQGISEVFARERN